MKTIAEIRRIRLEQLIERYGSITELNVALGKARTDSKLSQLRNASARKDRAKPTQMGEKIAREIEDVLRLEQGWMDNLPAYEDPSIDEKMRHLHKVAEGLAPYQIDQLIKIGATLAEPAPPAKNGTEH
ncbi:MAG: hypothetical protein Q7K57_51830 [Burkholderiaceae bacterium]|nr:hypothetical protein [Burkholderiaceae bacterium]